MSDFSFFLTTKSWNANSIILVSVKESRGSHCGPLCQTKLKNLVKSPGATLSSVQANGKYCIRGTGGYDTIHRPPGTFYRII